MNYALWIGVLIVFAFFGFWAYNLFKYWQESKEPGKKEKKSPFATIGEFASRMQESQKDADPDEFMPKGLVEKDNEKDTFSTDFSKFKNKGL
jgi:hypothetical protein